VLHSKFIEIFSKSKVKKEIKDSILKEWEFLHKNDDAELKNFFGKYRYQFLLGVTDTVEWYKTLLSIYSYAAISDQVVNDWRYDSSQGEYVKSPNVITAVTEDQATNYKAAKDLIKKEKTLAKKLEKKK
jgi:HSP90 family molecular chaperone